MLLHRTETASYPYCVPKYASELKDMQQCILFR